MNEAALIKSIDDKMQKTMQNLKAEFGKIRGNRASLAILDDIKVDYYGNMMPLKQIATLSTPEPRTITISPWDKSAIAAIEKTIQMSSIGITPNNDGTIIRLTMPALTEERRKEFVKIVKKISEEARVALRHIRRESNDQVKNDLKAKTITEDDEKRLSKKIQDMTDEFVRQVDSMATGKEKDIMEV
jgi:ribosome recycling factor